ncbi:MAG: hypothetical protein QOG38_822, partial [Hyphomicrobiales bacterium]|nr:hypothetical protein [Hyphomicrobiales bacterium]
MRLGVVALCLVMAAAASAEPAQKQSAPVAARKAAKAAKTKPTPKAEAKTKQPSTTATVPNPLSASYAALPLAQRVSIQADLIMTGDYAGSLSGEFGNDAIAAVKAFQKRKGNAETGVLNPKERAELATAAKPRQTARDWKVVDDTTAGVRLMVPAKMMPQASQISGGSRWASARGEMAVETFRVASGATLATVFAEMKKPANGRRVVSSSIEGNS